MNEKIASIIFIILSIIVLVFGCDYVHTFMHEHAHKNINTYYGVESLDIQINMFGKSFVKSQIPVGMDEDKYLSWVEMTSLNEIIGYNMSVLIQTLILCLGILCITMVIKDD